MAFYNKKYTDDCRAWISKNQNLYENTIDNIKSFLELGGLLHIYGVAVDNMPDRSLFLKYEDYKKYVKPYHKFIHSVTGVRTLLSRANPSFSILSSEEDIVYFCLSWLIQGDFYETLIYQIITCYDYPNNKNRQRGLKVLKNRFINESIYLGIKTIDDWDEYDKDIKEIKGWTVLSEDFVAPQTLGQEGDSPIVPVTDDNKKEGEPPIVPATDNNKKEEEPPIVPATDDDKKEGESPIVPATDDNKKEEEPPIVPATDNNKKEEEPPIVPATDNNKKEGEPLIVPATDDDKKEGEPPIVPSTDDDKKEGEPPIVPATDDDKKEGEPPKVPATDDDKKEGEPPIVPATDDDKKEGESPIVPATDDDKKEGEPLIVPATDDDKKEGEPPIVPATDDDKKAGEPPIVPATDDDKKEGESPIVPATDDNKKEGEPLIVPATDDEKEGEKDRTVDNKTDKAAFLNMLKCNDDKKKTAVIMAIADEIKSINSGKRIAFVMLALVKNKKIDRELSFLSFYEALTESIRPYIVGIKLVSRVSSSNKYYASKFLLDRNYDDCRNEKDKEELKELNRICNVLEAAENNA